MDKPLNAARAAPAFGLAAAARGTSLLAWAAGWPSRVERGRARGGRRRGDRPQPAARAGRAARGQEPDPGRRADRDEPARDVAPRSPGCAGTTATTCSNARDAGTGGRCSASSCCPTVREALRQLDATMQRSPTFDPADSDREFSIAASDYTVSILADPLLRLVNRTAPRIRLHLNALPGRAVHLRRGAGHARPADRPGRLRLPRPAHRAVPRPAGLRGRPGRERADRARR